MVHTQTDSAGQFSAVVMLSPSECNSVGPIGLPPHAEKTLEPLEHTVLTQTDPAGQFAAVTLLAQLVRMLQGALPAQMFILQIRFRFCSQDGRRKRCRGFRYDTSAGDNGPPAGGKRRLIREGGPASRVRDHVRPLDPGGGAVSTVSPTTDEN